VANMKRLPVWSLGLSFLPALLVWRGRRGFTQWLARWWTRRQSGAEHQAQPPTTRQRQHVSEYPKIVLVDAPDVHSIPLPEWFAVDNGGKYPIAYCRDQYDATHIRDLLLREERATYAQWQRLQQT
jgi:hypothetical protein